MKLAVAVLWLWMQLNLMLHCDPASTKRLEGSDPSSPLSPMGGNGDSVLAQWNPLLGVSPSGAANLFFSFENRHLTGSVLSGS